MSLRTRSNTRMSRLAGAGLIALVLPLVAVAADASKEIATAGEHAGYAASADSLAKVHLHLHHTVNCLVGADGQGFDQRSGNPCDGQGNGALNDMGDDASDRTAELKDARALALTGTNMQSLDAAKSVASTVHKMLEQAKSQ